MSKNNKKSIKYKRHIKYGTPVNFPNGPFTMSDYRGKNKKLTYITAYKRIEAALKTGEVIQIKDVEKTGEVGRPEKMFLKSI